MFQCAGSIDLVPVNVCGISSADKERQVARKQLIKPSVVTAQIQFGRPQGCVHGAAMQSECTLARAPPHVIISQSARRCISTRDIEAELLQIYSASCWLRLSRGISLTHLCADDLSPHSHSPSVRLSVSGGGREHMGTRDEQATHPHAAQITAAAADA
jgi:hypothetical protein